MGLNNWGRSKKSVEEKMDDRQGTALLIIRGERKCLIIKASFLHDTHP